MDPTGHVFQALTEEYARDSGATLAKRIGATFARAGIKTKAARSDRARNVTLYGAHSFRHLFVTVAASAGMSAAMVKSITGQATDDMLEHYQHLGADLAADIAARMSAKALPAAGVTLDASGEAAVLRGELEGLLAKVRGIAGRLGPKTWEQCRRELEALGA